MAGHRDQERRISRGWDFSKADKTTSFDVFLAILGSF
jgi:hypothetical protein